MAGLDSGVNRAGYSFWFPRHLLRLRLSVAQFVVSERQSERASLTSAFGFLFQSNQQLYFPFRLCAFMSVRVRFPLPVRHVVCARCGSLFCLTSMFDRKLTPATRWRGNRESACTRKLKLNVCVCVCVQLESLSWFGGFPAHGNSRWRR